MEEAGKPISQQNVDRKTPVEDTEPSEKLTDKQFMKSGEVQRVPTESCECSSDKLPDPKLPVEHVHKEPKESSSEFAPSERQEETAPAAMKWEDRATAKPSRERPADETFPEPACEQLQSAMVSGDEKSSSPHHGKCLLLNFMTTLFTLFTLSHLTPLLHPVRSFSRPGPCEEDYSEWKETTSFDSDDQDDDKKAPDPSVSDDKLSPSTWKGQSWPSSTKQPCENTDDTLKGESEKKEPALENRAPEKSPLKENIPENQMGIVQFSRIPMEHGEESFIRGGNIKLDKESSPPDSDSHTPPESKTTAADGYVDTDKGSASIVQQDSFAKDQAGRSNIADQKLTPATAAVEKGASGTEPCSQKQPEPVDQAVHAKDQNDEAVAEMHLTESGQVENWPAAENNQSRLMHQCVTHTTCNQGKHSTVHHSGDPHADFSHDVEGNHVKVTNHLQQHPDQEMFENAAGECQTPDQACDRTPNENSGTEFKSLEEDEQDVDQKNEQVTNQNAEHMLQQDHSENDVGECHEGYSPNPESNRMLTEHVELNPVEDLAEEQDAQQDLDPLQHSPGSELDICREPAVLPALEESDQHSETASTLNMAHTDGSDTVFQATLSQNTTKDTASAPLKNGSIAGELESPNQGLSVEGLPVGNSSSSAGPEENPVENSSTEPENAVENSSTEPENSVENSSTEPENSVENSSTEPENSVENSSTEPENPVENSSTEPENPVENSSTEPENPVENSSTEPENSVENSSTEPENPVENSSTEPENPTEDLSAVGLGNAADVQTQQNLATEHEANTASQPTGNSTQSAQRSVEEGVRWRRRFGRERRSRDRRVTEWNPVADLRGGGYVHCPLDAPRGRGYLPELRHFEEQHTTHGTGVSADASLQDLHRNAGNESGNLMQEFIRRLREEQQQNSPVCVVCEDHLADTVFLNCQHIVVCRQCAHHMTLESCCPSPECGAPVFCYIWLR